MSLLRRVIRVAAGEDSRTVVPDRFCARLSTRTRHLAAIGCAQQEP